MADVIKLTTISRIGDSLILCASMDSMNQTTRQMAELNRQAQSIVKSLNRDSPPRLHVEAGDHYIIYICERNVCYLTICDKSFPKKLAIRFLEDIAREFDVQNGSEVAQAQRPYQFIKFDTSYRRLRKCIPVLSPSRTCIVCQKNCQMFTDSWPRTSMKF